MTLSCKICGTQTKKVEDDMLHMMVPDDYPLKGHLDLHICHNCQFCFNETGAVNDDYGRYYTHFNKHHVRKGDIAELDIVYFDGLLDELKGKANFNPDGKHILDYGSGALLFSERAEKRGAEYARCYDVGGKAVDGKFDLVVSTHTFEHIFDVTEAFNELSSFTKDDGLILIAVPDLHGYDATYNGPFAQFDLEHINHFSEDSLCRLFTENGFDIVSTCRSDRVITPTLAYPEILVIGRKCSATASQPVIIKTSENDASAKIVAQVMARSHDDFELLYTSFKDTVAAYQNDENVIFGVYGLASYAFRFLRQCQLRGDFETISFLADSDARLSQFECGGVPILSKEQFTQMVAEHKNQKVVAFIAAINGHRILSMFEDEFSDSVIPVLLPPNCQNRGQNS